MKFMNLWNMFERILILHLSNEYQSCKSKNISNTVFVYVNKMTVLDEWPWLVLDPWTNEWMNKWMDENLIIQ